MIGCMRSKRKGISPATCSTKKVRRGTDRRKVSAHLSVKLVIALIETIFKTVHYQNIYSNNVAAPTTATIRIAIVLPAIETAAAADVLMTGVLAVAPWPDTVVLSTPALSSSSIQLVAWYKFILLAPPHSSLLFPVQAMLQPLEAGAPGARIWFPQ